MRKIGKNKKGVSEIVGVILMLGMAIALFAVVYIIAMDVIPYTPAAPSVRISGEIKNDTIYLQHNGGDSLSLDTKIFFSYDGNKTPIKNYTVNYYITSGKWDISEMLEFSDPRFNNSRIQMIIIDVESNSIIVQDVFKEMKDNV